MGPDYPLKRRLQQLEIGKNMIVVRLQFSIELQIRQFVSVSWDVKISPIYGMWLCTCPNLITGFVTRLTQRVPLWGQEQLTFLEHRSSLQVFCGVHVTRSLVLCVMFFRLLFVLLSFFFWLLSCLSFFNLRIPVI